MREPLKPSPEKVSTAEVVTFGCRLNLVESEEIARNACASGEKNPIVVNTCAVTAESVRQARQAIRRLHRERPEATIIVTGCAAQIDKEAFQSIDGVARVIGNGRKENAMRPMGDDAFDFKPSAKSDQRQRGDDARIPRHPKRLRSSLHILRHSVRARPVALGAAVGDHR